MSHGFIDLINQVQRVLRIRHGGTGNNLGMSRGTVFRAWGGPLALGTIVKRSTYLYEVVTPTTVADEITVLGVTVGNMDPSSDEIRRTSLASEVHVAVATDGLVNVRLG